jgi:hypothetical protein
MTPTWLWRFLVLVAGVTGLSLGWVSNAGPLGPLVFFTDQSNIAVAAYMAFLVVWPLVASRVPADGRLARARSSLALRGAITLYIIITGLIFAVVLQNLKDPLTFLSQGPSGVGTFLLHYVIPPAVVFDFLVLERRQGLKWVYAATWLLYPLAYLAYAFIRGALFTKGQYPYPFLDVAKDGYLGVTINAVIYGILFYLLGLFLILLGRLSSRSAPSQSALPTREASSTTSV